MELPFSFKRFVKEHVNDDLNRLLLCASRFPDIDVPFAVEQIASRRQIREKLPSWYANDDLIFPAKVAAEQCSSEQTGKYKQRLVDKEAILCDLTGGLGIDSFYFSEKVKKVIYIERYETYSEAARHNFKVLDAVNVEVLQGDSNQTNLLPAVDVFYIDPARRGEGNKRVFALSDCEPDLPYLLPFLWERSSAVIAKLSPMADIQQTLGLLPQTTEIHVLSVKNECKELLFVMQRNNPQGNEVGIRCVNFNSTGKEESFNFTMAEERSCVMPFADRVKLYLYEPNASILKAGAFKSVAFRLQIEKLAASSHLYTSDHIVDSFPGRSFQVEELLPFTGKLCKSLHKTIPQANITVRNFPLSVDELRKRTKIADGGAIYLFATTLADGEKVFLKCRKL